MYAKKTVNMKLVVLLLAIVLLIGCVAGGTFAWLIAESGPVENTFVAGSIGTLTLVETDEDKSFTIIPGDDIEKDPTVTFNSSIDAYVFVSITATGWDLSDKTYNINSNKDSGSDDTGLTWTVSDDWTVLDATAYPGVYYKAVKATDSPRSWSIIKNDTIDVSTCITETSINDYTGKPLIFQAYAIQAEGHTTAAAAWTALGSA